MKKQLAYSIKQSHKCSALETVITVQEKHLTRVSYKVWMHKSWDLTLLTISIALSLSDVKLAFFFF